MFLGMEWYWWLIIAVVVVSSIPLKVKFIKWWTDRQKEQSQNHIDKWGDDE